MAEESTSTTDQASAADFDKSDLEVPTKEKKTSNKEENPAQDEEWEGDFDPTNEEFEIKLPSKEETDATQEKEGLQKVDKSEKAEEKKAGGDSEKSSKPESKKPSEEKSDKKNEEKPQVPLPPKTIKVKIDEKEHDIPEEAYEAIKERIDHANRIQGKVDTFVKSLLENPSGALLDLFTRHNNGDRDKAYNSLIQEYSRVLKDEIEFQSLPDEKKEAVMASQKAKRLEEELNRYRNQEAETQKRSEEARKIESLMGEVTKVMQEIKIPLTEDNKDLAIEALEKLRLLREQGKNPSVKDLVAWVNAKRNKESVERDQKYTESINTLPDEVLKQRHGSLIERLRKLDLAEINKGRSTAKTSQPKEGTEPEKSPRSKQKVLNSVEWDKYWR
jgi:hypothetical protein